MQQFIPMVPGSSTTTLTTPFIIRIDTTETGLTAYNQYRYPSPSSEGLYDIYWGDGTSSIGISGPATHTYWTPGVYDISVYKDASAIQQPMRNANYGDPGKIIDILQFGNVKFSTLLGFCFGCTNLSQISATDAPDLLHVTSADNGFRGCTSLTAFPTHWDLSGIESFRSTWENTPNMTTGFDSYNLSSAIDLQSTWLQYFDRVGLLSWNCTTSTSLTNLANTWQRCNLSQCGGGTGVFPWFEARNVTNISAAWFITTVSNLSPNMDFSSVVNASYAFFGGGFLGFLGEIFPALDWTSVQNAESMWDRCANLTFSTHPRLISMTNGAECFTFGNDSLSPYYDDFINDMDANNPNDNVTFGAATAQYSAASYDAYQRLLARGWIITDGGPTFDVLEDGAGNAIEDGSGNILIT